MRNYQLAPLFARMRRVCNPGCMSQAVGRSPVPEWDLADRMRKGLREADISVQEIADYLGVGRNTVSRWINGRIAPSVQTLRLWALRTGVPYAWLRDGTTPDGPGSGDARPEGFEPPTFWLGPDPDNVIELRPRPVRVVLPVAS